MNKYDWAIEDVIRTDKPVAYENFVVYPVVDTTMRVIDEAIIDGKPHGFTAIALQQSNGGGSPDPLTGKQRRWESPFGNLYVSRIFDKPPLVHRQVIEFLGTLSVGEVVRDLIPDEDAIVALTYPNGVTVNGKKLAGIYVPPSLESEIPATKVNLGIGIDILKAPTVDVAHQGAEISDFTCLARHGCSVSIGEVLEKLDHRLEKHWHEFQSDGSFERVLSKLGYLDPKTQLLQATIKETGLAMTAHFEGFVTRPNEQRVPTNYLILNENGKTQEYKVRALSMGSVVSRKNLHDFELT